MAVVAGVTGAFVGVCLIRKRIGFAAGRRLGTMMTSTFSPTASSSARSCDLARGPVSAP
jgi:hypothetical protein